VNLRLPAPPLPRLRQLAGEHKLFSGALAVGAFLRLLAVLGYPGALWFAGDSYVYIGAALRPQPNLSKTTGYSLFLRVLLPFHSLTLVVVLQHLMSLAVAVLLYALLRRAHVSKTWSAVATLPVLLDGYLIEDEHLIMAEPLFTFCLMVAMALLLWRPQVRWWTALVIGLLIGYAAIVRTEGAVVLVIFPLYLLLRGKAWKTTRGWIAAVLIAVASLIPVGSYAAWFHSRTGHYGMTMSTGYYLWGRVSSFADCARIKPAGAEAAVCPKEPLSTRTPPGNFIWHASEVHATPANPKYSPVTTANNKLLTDFAIHAVEAQPLSYAKTVFFNTMLSFGFPRIAYPGVGTVYFYNFHLRFTGTHRGKPVSLLPPNDHAWISPLTQADSAYNDWVKYGHQAPGTVNKVFAAPLAVYQRLVFTYGPLLLVIFLTGLGGVIQVRRKGRGMDLVKSLRLSWAPRGTSVLPWLTAVALLVVPIAVADFDYRYLLPVLPFACLAAGLAFAPRLPRGDGQPPSAGSSPADVESTVPDSVS
jgi:hypothetical protein